MVKVLGDFSANKKLSNTFTTSSICLCFSEILTNELSFEFTFKIKLWVAQ